MAIDKVNNVNAINQINRVNKVNKSLPVGNDRIEISSEAKTVIELQKMDEALKAIPDVRMDKVEAAKARLSTYMENGVIKEEILDKMAANILDDLIRDFAIENDIDMDAQ